MATASTDPSVNSTQTARVALVGNPNTGKSTLFNALAGMHVRTGNYPGVTIEKKIGRCQIADRSVDLVDLPGTYSLAPRSPDELVAVEVLTDEVKGEPPIGLIICVVNATQLQRNLFLVSQLMELRKPLIIALNMIDSAESRGVVIDCERLSEQLGVPVIATSASKRKGIDRLKEAISDQLSEGDLLDNRPRDRVAEFSTGEAIDRALPDAFYSVRDEFRTRLEKRAAELGNQGLSVPSDYLIERMLLDRGGESERQATALLGPEVEAELQEARGKLSSEFGNAIDMECNSRYAWSKRKLKGVISDSAALSAGITDRIDMVLTNRIGGLIFFLLVMFVIFQSIYSLAGWPMDMIDAATGAVADGIDGLLAPGMLRSLLTDGVIAGVGGVLIFLPQIALLFFFLAILEDCGYMARAAFLVDRVMTSFGLSGKSFLPLMSSFACAVPGVMAARVIENRRDRLATIMVAPLMSCSARLPVYLLLIAAFIPTTTYLGGWLSLPALVLMSMYLVGALTAVPVAWLLKKTLLRGEAVPFVLELPEYKMPSPRVVLARVWEASQAFVIRAGTLIFAASILIWFAGYWPGDHERQFALQAELESVPADSSTAEVLREELHQESSELLENSLLGTLGHAIEPVVRPLGWDWKIGVGAIASFPAREVIIATLGTIYSLGGEAEEEGLVGAIRGSTYPDGTPVYSIPVALSIMVFFALCAQCVSTLLVIRRETNSWFWPILSFSYMTVLAYLGALVTYQVGTRFF